MRHILFIALLLMMSVGLLAQKSKTARAMTSEQRQASQTAFEARVARLDQLGKEARMAAQLYLEIKAEGGDGFLSNAISKTKAAISYATHARRDLANAKDPAWPARDAELLKTQHSLEDLLQMLRPESGTENAGSKDSTKLQRR